MGQKLALAEGMAKVVWERRRPPPRNEAEANFRWEWLTPVQKAGIIADMSAALDHVLAELKKTNAARKAAA